MSRVVIIVFLVLITLPFIFMTNLFPFLRFGMFAEPVRYNLQSERLVVLVGDSLAGQLPFDPSQVGMEPNMFVNLTRNYYYRGQSERFLSVLNDALTDSLKPRYWDVVRVMPSLDDSISSDTTLIFRYIPAADTLLTQ